MVAPNQTFQPRNLRDYCLDHLGATEDFPFGPDVVVYRVRKKIFALGSLDAQPWQFNLKCDPEYARILRQNYPQIIPGYHMNKRHWNTIIPDATLPLDLIHEMIDHSYTLVGSRSKTTR